jgi:uncharacterized BrkB/YihY/UPF0761 family membrane protein
MSRDAADSRRRPLLSWVLFALLVLQALGGLAGGGALAARPDGSLLKMPLSYIQGSPFPDYRVPGLLLFLVLGVFPLVVAIGLLRRRPWAWFGAFAVGCGLIIFEVVEYGVIGYNVQQPVWGSVGALIALTSLAPSVQRDCGLRWGRRI